MLAVNTLGVLYILENGTTINSISDLSGKTIYATGQGSTPEYILNYILTENSLEPGRDVTIEYLSEHSELTAKAASGDAASACCPNGCYNRTC
jgi:NitT/TauT family transport system substrate-binding protein